MMRTILLNALACLSLAAPAQKQGQAMIAPLLAELPRLQSDSLRTNLLLEVSDAYSYIDASKGLKYGLQGLEIAERANFRKQKAELYNVLGINYETKSEFSAALEYYFKALNTNEQNGNKRGMAANLSNIANVFMTEKQDSTALAYLDNAIAINKDMGNKIYLSINLGNMGTQKKYAEALEGIQQALQLNRENNDPGNEIINLVNLASVQLALKEIGSALRTGLDAQEKSEILGDSYLAAAASTTLGLAYLELATDTSGVATTQTGIPKQAALQQSIEWLRKGFAQNGCS